MDDVKRTLAIWAIAAGAVFTAVGEAGAQMDLGAWLRGEQPQRAAMAHPSSRAVRPTVRHNSPNGQLQPVAYQQPAGGMADEIIFESPADELSADGAASGSGVVATCWNRSAPCAPAYGPVCEAECGGPVYGGECGGGCGVGGGVGCAVGHCGGCGAGQVRGMECGGDGRGDCGGHPMMSPYWGQPGCGILAGIGRNLSLHAGVQGFKGPVDFGRNGNFGLHEGFNFAGPFGGPWGFGYQFGLNIVHSNFSGDAVWFDRGGDRDQVFFTGGIFRRAPNGGWQWGAAVDFLHDSYYDTVNISQVRSESSYVFRGGIREIGYFGMYGTGDDRIERVNDMQVEFEPTDLFAFFYRRHFSGGGNGRLWAGFSGRGDGLVGGDFHVPLGEGRWSLVNRFNYLVPKQGSNMGGSSEESWGVTMQLVWYPGQPARCAERNKFRALLDVADNTLFLVDRGVYGGGGDDAE